MISMSPAAMLVFMLAEVKAIVMMMMLFLFMDHDYLFFPRLAGGGDRCPGCATEAAADDGTLPAADRRTDCGPGRATDGPADHRVTIHRCRQCRHGKPDRQS